MFVWCRAPLPAEPRIEVGVRGGLTALENESRWIRYWSLPGGGPPLMGNAYATFFTGGATALEPYFGLQRIATSDDHSTQIALGAQVMRFTNPDAAASSAYGFVNGGMLGGWSSGSSSASYQLGGGLGCRTVVRGSLALRIEGRYRRWFDDSSIGLNELSLGIGVGALLGPD